ncbi:uncharacterized protein LOC133424377 [Cololabis saira]|uniref:uncharacterized protein LOC133424322 n=1 Tax=Cololabis saira TaxID=129043 RepID=UPI002AD2BB3F|nr:uncharacterized protein LOC133424322 [Cololabis saira]XP_061570859.1 uncharacterized protein LOC133424343 [Cololabis saira]XP_061570915.1 uncharacterized protein LOC133424377 [Cololabis saira]XP_061570916.1 uncharacterized protein LOC133424377 [Cololabis saira]
MKTAGFFLRVSLCMLLIVESSGMHLKGSKSHQQSGGGGSGAGGNFASYQGAPTGHSAPVLYSAPRLVSAPVLVQNPNAPQLVGYTTPVGSSLDSAAPAVGSGSAVPLQAGAVGSGSAVPLQAGPVGTGSVVPLQPGYVVSGSSVPFQAGAVGSGPAGAETEWAVPPQSLTEAADDAQTMDASGFLPSPPLPPPQPSFQAGEAASVMREAELGNFQRQTEEFGYPADQLGQGQQGFTSVVHQFGVGGFSAHPYPDFDYKLLYGLYPPGTQTTFSQHHEKGKDFSQAVHYLTEHASDDHGSVQQKKVFQAAS